MLSLRISILWTLAALGRVLLAQAGTASPGGDEAPPPKKKPPGEVRIYFTPPPMDGAITMGIFDSTGKLVRVLHREATDKDFRAGLNGFITKWDGMDDSGAPAPAGKYSVRGWSVGDIRAEGVAFHCNDWARDEGPRYSHVVALKASSRDEVRITVRDAGGAEVEVGWDLKKEGAAEPRAATQFEVKEGGLTVAGTAVELGEDARAVAASAGFDGNVWAIVEVAGTREVRAYSAQGEFLRRLAYAEGAPQPRQIAGSQWSETVFLLDENDREQRLRALALTEKDGAPVWETVYEKRIVFSDTFEAVTGALGRPEPVRAEKSVRVMSKANPLLQNKRTAVEVVARCDESGALLATADGLPLARVSDRKGLKWAVLAREEKNLRLFTGDGSVVEEFAIGRPENLMEFDAGEYELRR